MLNETILNSLIDLALREDIGTGDITTNSIIPAGSTTIGFIKAKQAGVLAGIGVAEAVFKRVNPSLKFTALAADGDKLEAGQIIANVEGDARAILTGERLALNFMQRMSGIATRTARLVEVTRGCRARVVDTRKTTPGLRMLEKYAVRVGGGHNHRFGLYDAVLVKDNHIKVAGGIAQAVKMARAAIPHTMKVEVEVEDFSGLDEALNAGADIVMLDNMDAATMRQAVELAAGRALLEASGGISEETIRTVAETGVDIISVGALTHSIQALDISLDVKEIKPF